MVHKIILSQEELELKDKLVEAASKRATLFYGELIEKVDPYNIGILSAKLDRITGVELNEGRPMLCAIVINKSTGLPGEGFWELCDTLGVEDESWEDIRDKCFDYWGKYEK